MSKQLLVLVSFCMVFTSYVFAQQKTSGVIYYTQVIDTRAMRGNTQGGQVQAQRPNGFTMPDQISTKMELVFTVNGAKFQKSEVEDDISDAGSGQGARMMRFGGAAERETFFSFEDKKVTESFEMDGEQLLLQKSLGTDSLEITKFDDVKKIIGFDCKKAVLKDKRGMETTIWYTNELPFAASPAINYWTEGVVLGVENQRIKYYATSIEYIKVKDSELALPKKARMISEEEYREKQAEFRKKIQEQFRNRTGGTSPNQVIIREGGN